MPNPSLPTFGGLAADGMWDATPSTGIKRAYGSESSGGDPLMHQGVALIPAAVSAVDQKANATATATLPAVALKRNYLAGFAISGSGATVAAVVRATITGIGVTWGIDVPVPAGILLGITPIIVVLPNPIPASAVNTAITLTVPAFGSGYADVSVAIWGYLSA